MAKRDPIERFLEKFDIGEIPEGFDSPCFVWTASLKGAGYGQFWNGYMNSCAHRFCWEYFVDDIPENLEIDHLCLNKICVNPDHLEVVTHRENQIRWGCGRPEIGDYQRRKTHCPQGHPYSGDNLYTEYNKKTRVTSRRCRICSREKMRKSL